MGIDCRVIPIALGCDPFTRSEGLGMKRILVGCFMWLLALPLAAGNGPGAVRKQVEASMLLTGTILVGPEGQVVEHSIDQPDKVPRQMLDFVGQSVEEWKFEPTLLEGKPVSVRNKMSVRLIARKTEDGKFKAYIGGVDFQPFSPQTAEGTEIASQTMTPPSFPMSAAEAGIQGTVYLVIRVGRNGRVEDLVPEQVNLKIVASESKMRYWREVFARSAMKTAQQWVFTPPAKGENADLPFWSVRVPVDYKFYGEAEKKYGEWDAYVPGPRQEIPWKNWSDLPGFSPDALVAGGVQQVGGNGGLRLLTPLSGS